MIVWIIAITAYVAVALFSLIGSLRKGKNSAKWGDRLRPLRYVVEDLLLYTSALLVVGFIWVFILHSPNVKLISQTIENVLYMFIAYFGLKIIFHEIPLRLAYRHYKKKLEKSKQPQS